MKPMHKPIQIAMFLHTKTEECNSREECVRFLQERQKLDMEEFDDIQFNFYISSDGAVYEGRGWDIEADKNSEDYETANRSVDIAYIGDFENKDLSQDLIQVGCDLIFWAKKIPGLLHEHINITTFWEDHIHILRDKQGNYNPLDDPATRDEEYKQDFPEPPWD
uniref:Peptidoglycan recognition protein 18 n=1 Tax=Nephotettix cincticeps TaxID=94400 RepID=A0A5H2WX66_NEPCI|nr:peptidoglycan recognition protein 18 [Nephotettix cincticeps]